eukprot:gene28536-37494_t
MRAISSTAKREVIDSRDIQMPTPLSAGFDMKFQRANGKNDQKRPLVVIAGWMGAKERQLNPYISFYHSKNIDTLSFAVGPKHVLFPSDSKKQMEAVIDFISNPSDPSITAPSCILFHHFSVGGFLYGLLLLLLKEDKRFDSFIPMIRAQIFDSPPDYKSIASGMARSMGFTGIGQNIVEFSASAYLKLTENYAGVLHRASSAAFHGNEVPAPSLWFYSKADPVSKFEDCNIVIEKWKARGIQVQQCMWDDTPHIQHARYDPKRYFGTLEAFLLENKIISP